MKKLMNIFSLVFLTTIFLTAQETASVENNNDDIATVHNEMETSSESCTLTVEFTNLKSDEGQIIVGLYNSEGTWLKKNIKGKSTNIENGTATVIFNDVPFGDYAISAIHDKDMDGKLKTGAFGIPKEPYASSRGAKGRFGPPKWKDAVFTLSTTTASETIKY